jgi:hypothetical protein
MKKLIALLICSTLLFAQAALAGGGHDHGPKHGGVVREASSVTYELVARADSLTLHVSDHGKPIATAGATAQVTLYAGNEKTGIVLEPAGDNRMEAKGNFKVGIGVRAALAITLPGKAEKRIGFNLK